MSAFGYNNFKSDVYENLGWLISESPIEQLNFIHGTSIELIENGVEHINDYIKNCINEWELSIDEAKLELGEVYSYILAYKASENSR